MMRHLRTFILLFLPITSAGCGSSTHINHGFASTSTKVAHVTINLKVSGRDKRTDFGILRSAPYDAWFWLEVPGATEGCSAEVALLNAVAPKGTTSLLEPGVRASLREAYDGIMKISFYRSGLGLTHERHEVTGQLNLDPRCGVDNTRLQIVMSLKPFIEQREITFWDALMGV